MLRYETSPRKPMPSGWLTIENDPGDPELTGIAKPLATLSLHLEAGRDPQGESWRILAGKVTPKPAMTREQHRAMASLTRSFEGTRYRIERTPAGLLNRLTETQPDLAIAEVQEPLKEGVAFLKTLVTPFPAEPVGVGGQWEVAAPVEIHGMTMPFLVRYQLVARRGNRVEITGRMDLQVDPKHFPQELHGTLAEEKLELGMKAQLEARIVQDLSLPDPLKADLKLVTDMTYNGKNDDGEPIEVTNTMSYQLKWRAEAGR